jgi:hypothetical protein
LGRPPWGTKPCLMLSNPFTSDCTTTSNRVLAWKQH